MSNRGSLACVGIGMTLGSHLTPLSRSHIEQADVVFTAVSDGIVELWINKMNSDVRSLQPLYSEGSSRMDTYNAMVDAILSEVRAGRRVCAAFYGHPGVFAWPAHRAIEIARGEGYEARMEPGISAEDTLYADLGFDPGRVGCQHYEATQLMLYRRRIDTSAYLVVWQIGVAGDRTLTRFATGSAYRELLLEVLKADYPLNHEVILYEAATLPVHSPRIERIRLAQLTASTIEMHTTLVIPPCTAMEANQSVRDRLMALDEYLERDISKETL